MIGNPRHHEYIFCDDVMTSEPQTVFDARADLKTNNVEIEEEIGENANSPTTPMLQMPSWPTIPCAKNLDFLSWSNHEKCCNFSKRVFFIVEQSTWVQVGNHKLLLMWLEATTTRRKKRKEQKFSPD